MKTCIRCKKVFKTIKGNYRYCHECRFRNCQICGNEFHSKNIKARFCGEKCRNIFAKSYNPPKRKGCKLTPGQRIKWSEVQKGSRCHFWKGGVTQIYHTIRNNINYKLWRETIFQRDNWTCQSCGKRGGYLEAHHIKPFAYYPNYRFDFENGITYCSNCHIKNDKYRSQFKKEAL